MNSQTIPEGWSAFDVPNFAKNQLCHSDKPWWRGPDGTEYCGSCHPEPWKDPAGIVKDSMTPPFAREEQTT